MKKGIALGLAFCLLFAAAPLAAAAEENDPAACAHEVENWTFAGDGAHTGVCALCGETVTADCVYAEPAVYISKEDGTHAETCTVCGGERISPCEFGEAQTLLPGQETAGAVTRACVRCGYTETLETLPPEAEREKSRPLGDATGDGGVKADDARAILRAAVSLESLSPQALAYADMDGDGEILAADARLALRVSVELDPVIRHDYTAALQKAAACTEAGSLTRTCGYCGETGEVVIPATGHDYEEVTVPATCTKDGSVTKTCKVCGDVKKTVRKAVGHDYVEVTVPATCTTDGSVTKTCKACGDVQKTVIKATGHDYELFAVAPACEKEGSITKVCRVCGNTEVTPVAPTGHQWVAATAQKAKHCSACGAVVPGWTAVNGKYYYFNEDGAPVLNQIVDRQYVDEKGVRCDDTVIRHAVNYVIVNGGSGTAAEKLKHCYNAMVRTCTYTRIYGNATTDNLPQKAANMFVYHTGHCYSYASMFAYIAKVLGYRARVNSGQIRSASGSMAAHGWTELYIAGGWYMFDVTSHIYRGINGYMRTHANFPIYHVSGTLFYLQTDNGAAYWTK